MSGDDDIIIAGEDPIEETSHDPTGPRCEDCGAELEWKLTLDCVQKQVCPRCSD